MPLQCSNHLRKARQKLLRMLRRLLVHIVPRETQISVLTMDVTADFKSFQDKVTSSLVNVTRGAGQLAAEDLSFHRSSSSRLSKSLDAQNARLLQLTSKLLKAAAKDTNNAPPKLRSQEDVEDKWRSTVDVIDDLLEKSDACLDEFTGVIKRLSPALQDGTATPPMAKERPQKMPSIFHSSAMPKPQLLFQRAVANDDTARFKPLLRSKPHAVVPLEESIGREEPKGCVLWDYPLESLLTVHSYKHPYATEIKQTSYPASAYMPSEPVPFTPPAESQAIFVDTDEAVNGMLSELKLAKEIAVDLEHHDTHSYIGIVSLMQISTRDKDWIVDTLKPWRENLQVLNEVFADPKILKVFHGSHEDMMWLQRDLGLYVVGLFDTYYACVALNFEGRGLKYLLKRFANFDAQKKYQTADWRLRPIPDQMLDYARSDTHYLLYIYDNLRNMLLEASTPASNLMDYVCAESKKEALQRYERPVYDDETGLGSNGWYNSLMRRNFKFDKEQFAVYRALHQWRDQLARELDEGVPFIMTAAQLFTISEAMPMSMPGLMSSVRPITKAISDNARQLVDITKKAKDNGKSGPPVMDILRRCQEKADAEGIVTVNKWRERKSKQDIGVGAMVQMIRDEQNKEAVVSYDKETKTVASRSQSSTLWGSILSATATAEPALPGVAVDALRMLLPLPAKKELSFVDSSAVLLGDTVPYPATVPIPVANDTPVIERSVDDVFVIRDSGRKRKIDDTLEAEEIESSISSATNGTPISNAAPSSISLRETTKEIDVEIKAQRKAEKRLKKEQRKAEQAQLSSQATPFDYAKAESVLHHKPPVPEKGAEKAKGTKRPFNPNLKALDTSTGMKRARKEESGKSFTFKR